MLSYAGFGASLARDQKPSGHNPLDGMTSRKWGLAAEYCSKWRLTMSVFLASLETCTLKVETSTSVRGLIVTQCEVFISVEKK